MFYYGENIEFWENLKKAGVPVVLKVWLKSRTLVSVDGCGSAIGGQRSHGLLDNVYQRENGPALPGLKGIFRGYP
jgi:hypothetical protein